MIMNPIECVSAINVYSQEAYKKYECNIYYLNKN